MNKYRRRYRKRSGMVLFAVLVCIGVALALTMAAMQSTLNQRRHLSRTLQMQQTRLLLDAAADSPAIKKWREAQNDIETDDTAGPLKVELELPSGKQATITAAVEPNQEKYLLTAMIGDAQNQTFVTRRSKSASLKTRGKDD